MPRSAQDPQIPQEGGHARHLWPLLAVFAVAVPAALFVVEKFGAHHFGFSFFLILLASLAGYAVAVDKVVQERLGESRRRTRMLVWLAAAVLFLGSVTVFFLLRPPPPPLARMVGARDVAVAGFAAADDKLDQQTLDDLAAEFAREMKRQLRPSAEVRSYAADAALPLTELRNYLDDSELERKTAARASDVRALEWKTAVRASDVSELEQKTADFAEMTNAEIVVAGLAVAEPGGGQTRLWPAVYIRSDRVTNLPELEGWYVGESPIILTGWNEPQERDQLHAQLTQEVGALAKFLEALGAWRKGNPAEAEQILDGLLDPKQQGDGNSFVPSDLALLFHGAAAEQQAPAQMGPSRTKFLETARKDYERIMDPGTEDTPTSRPSKRAAAARARAAISLQVNAYRRAIDPMKLCQPETVKAAELAQVSQSLKALADNQSLNDLGRLKAVVNRAQVEECRILARLVTDDGAAVKEALKKLSDARDVTGAAELRAFAESIAANHEYRSGDKPAAIKHIRAAIKDGRDPSQRAIWHGLLARWSLERCDLQTGRTARQDALDQYDAAKRRGRGDPSAAPKYEKDSAVELENAEKRCPDDER
ncbi:hypothetical protein ABT237_11365 [Streptomyces sp. NPDC001581]|uniref:hypothetical protein n=1 Tax=Streptomyces sp. NPDC001581 TaxID=3154386 RepID=UPI00331966CA